MKANYGFSRTSEKLDELLTTNKESGQTGTKKTLPQSHKEETPFSFLVSWCLGGKFELEIK
jgi:hypothetical protein